MADKLKKLLLVCICACISAMLYGCGKVPGAVSSPVPSESVRPEPSAETQTENPPAEPSSEPDTAPAEEEQQPADIFSAFRAEAALMVSQMSTEAKVWQVFLAAIPKGADAAGYAEEHPAGGYLLFRWDFENLDADGVREKLESLSEGEVKPLLAVDEEGGEIVRVSWYPALRENRFPAPSVLWAQGGADAVYGDAYEKGQFLSSLGINLCLAPVADVSQDPEDYIYPRTIGGNAQETGWYVSAAVKGLQDGGVGSTLKHFPGYGSNVNTHTGVAVDNRLMAQFRNEDLLPFKAGIEAGCGSILVSHNIVKAFDGSSPASLSEPVHRFLREEMGFSGLIMTDDLIMDAITEYTGEDSPSAAALKAGNDLIIHSDAESGVEDVLAALESGALDMAVVDRAAEQVIAFKLWLEVL